MELIARAAFKCEGISDPDWFKGVAVKEKHSDQLGCHLHGVYWCKSYFDPRGVIDRARAKDQAIRGWKEAPQTYEEEIRRGGRGEGRRMTVTKTVAGTGVRWHLFIATAHVYTETDTLVVAGKKKVGAFKAKSTHDEWCSYVMHPSPSKPVVDSEPLFANCHPDEVRLQAERDVSALEMVQAARGSECIESCVVSQCVFLDSFFDIASRMLQWHRWRESEKRTASIGPMPWRSLHGWAAARTRGACGSPLTRSMSKIVALILNTYRLLWRVVISKERLRYNVSFVNGLNRLP